MDNVHTGVKESVDTIEYVWTALLGAWGAAPMELRAFVLTVFTISILMEWVKRAFLAGLPKRRRVSLLWLASLPLGIALAVAGYQLADGHIHVGYWAVIGLTSGIVAMGVHFVTIKIILPAAATLGGALWTRLVLLVRGAPSNE